MAIGVRDLPRISASNYTNATYDGSGTATGISQAFNAESVFPPSVTRGFGIGKNEIHEAQAAMFQTKQAMLQIPKIPHQKPKELPAMAVRRLVKVVIVDPDERVPLDSCILHNGKEQLTDLTDQELFFEIDIKNIIADHNFCRTKIKDKTVKEREEFLEPVKVRDLRMVVVTVATF
jgi:hypothetical protein